MDPNTWLWTSNAAQRFGHLPTYTLQGHSFLWSTDTDQPPDMPYTDTRLVAACFVAP